MKKTMMWIFRIVAAAIMLQTLFFKFTAHPESVALFTELGIEPWGRIGTGVLELAAAILILVPATTYLGALLSIGLMMGAIGSHLTVLGIFYGGDALLFVYAVIVLVTSAFLAFFESHRVLLLMDILRTKFFSSKIRKTSGTFRGYRLFL